MRKIPFILACVLVAASLSCIDNGVKGPPGGGGDGGDGGDGPIFLGRPPVIINEVNAANVDYKDEFGDTPGWAELYNPADTAVSLNGYYLTGNASRKAWAFGNVALTPRGYATVFLSGRNKPDLEPPRDSIDLIRGAVGAWAWADNQATPRGRSTAEHSFVPNASVGGKLNAVENPPAPMGLGWTTALVMLKLAGWDTTDVVDLSGANQVLLRGYISKNAELEVRFSHRGLPEWEAWGTTLRGTGVENDLYVIELPPEGVGNFNARVVYGLRLANPSSFRGTIDFNFTSIVAQKRGYSPHASFELNSGGGRLFLLDGEGHIRDSIAYSGGVRGLSFARRADGRWALSQPPTPNAANETGAFYDGQAAQVPAADIPKSGFYEGSLAFTLPAGTGGGVICCDTSGRLPTENSALRSGARLALSRTAIMRCAQFKAESYPGDPILRTYIVESRAPSLPVVSIAVDPVDMFDNTVGIYSLGPNASSQQPNYGANFWKDIELPIHVDFFEGGARHAWSYPAGIKIFGGWSRAHAKRSVSIRFRDRYGQKNLKYALFPDQPQLTKFKSFILRNGGNSFGLDYIRDMMMTSLTDGLGIEYQKGRAAIVYYNGQYYGIHNIRERSNRHYFNTNFGIEEEDLDLVKGNNQASTGSDADYQDVMRWLGGVTLDDNNLKMLEQRIDVDNYTNYIQSEIYYVNTDWPGNNLKRWRTSSPPSKWRWFMYDTDYGFDYRWNNNRGVNMLNFVTATNGPDWPNPPHSTFLTRKLFENEGYKAAFVNRFSLLIATQFAPERINARIDALMAPIESEIRRDQQRWGHDASTMSQEVTTMKNFGRDRPARMRRELEGFFSLGSSPVDFTVSSSGSGKVLVHNLPVPGGSATFKAYPAAPVVLKAVPGPGAAFNGWSDGVGQAERVVTIREAMAVEARFSGAAF